MDIHAKIEHALDNIRPYLRADGGDVKIKEITDNGTTVHLELTGACGTCPMSTMTFKAGLEETILKAIPEIKQVKAINLTPLPH